MRRMWLYTDAFYVSPYVFSCYVSLRERGLPFQLKKVALHEQEQRAVGYRATSLTGRVPALEHEGFWVSESSAILEYLDETFPDTPRALPEDRHKRARARQIMAWLRSDLQALRDERPSWSIFYRRPIETPLTDQGRAAADTLIRIADAL